MRNNDVQDGHVSLLASSRHSSIRRLVPLGSSSDDNPSRAPLCYRMQLRRRPPFEVNSILRDLSKSIREPRLLSSRELTLDVAKIDEYSVFGSDLGESLY